MTPSFFKLNLLINKEAPLNANGIKEFSIVLTNKENKSESPDRRSFNFKTENFSEAESAFHTFNQMIDPKNYKPIPVSKDDIDVDKDIFLVVEVLYDVD